MLAIPLVECTMQIRDQSKNDQKTITTQDLAILVEKYTCLMDNRPDYMKYVVKQLYF